MTLSGNELNGNYRNGATNNPSMSSSQRGDLASYIHNTTSQHPVTLNSYPSHPNMIAAVNGSTPTHLPYFSPNPVRDFNDKFDYLFSFRSTRVL